MTNAVPMYVKDRAIIFFPNRIQLIAAQLLPIMAKTPGFHRGLGLQSIDLLVAGVGFEPTTFGL